MDSPASPFGRGGFQGRGHGRGGGSSHGRGEIIHYNCGEVGQFACDCQTQHTHIVGIVSSSTK